MRVTSHPRISKLVSRIDLGKVGQRVETRGFEPRWPSLGRSPSNFALARRRDGINDSTFRNGRTVMSTSFFMHLAWTSQETPDRRRLNVSQV
jgi:hypothetical protein